MLENEESHAKYGCQCSICYCNMMLNRMHFIVVKYMFKVNKRNARTRCDANGVVLVSLLFPLNIFHNLF